MIDDIVARHRGGAGAGRLFQQLLPASRAGGEVQQPARLARAVLRRPSDGRRGRLCRRHRQAAAARRDVPLCRPDRAHLRSRGPGQLRGYCGHEEIELALVKLAGSPASAVHGSGALFHRRARQPAALFRHRGAGARQRSGGLVSPDLQIQPVACPGARAGQGGGACGAGDVSVFGDGGPGGRGRRCRA